MKHYKKDDFELIDFTLLSKKDLALILQWRNHDLIRRWMVNKNIISHGQHISFVKSLKNVTNKQQWMVLQNDEKIGVMNMNFDSNKFGMYIAPDKQGKGYVVWMLKNFLDFIFIALKLPIVRLEVYANNQTALRLYARFRFVEKQRKDNLIYMQLENPYESK